MISETASISQPTDSPSGRLNFRVVVSSAGGQPLAGKEVKFTLEGDGSFAPTFSAKEAPVLTDAEGHASVTWYRRGIFLRTAKATLTVTYDGDDATLAIETLDPAAVDSGSWISWAPTRRRF